MKDVRKVGVIIRLRIGTTGLAEKKELFIFPCFCGYFRVGVRVDKTVVGQHCAQYRLTKHRKSSTPPQHNACARPHWYRNSQIPGDYADPSEIPTEGILLMESEPCFVWSQASGMDSWSLFIPTLLNFQHPTNKCKFVIENTVQVQRYQIYHNHRMCIGNGNSVLLFTSLGKTRP